MKKICSLLLAILILSFISCSQSKKTFKIIGKVDGFEGEIVQYNNGIIRGGKVLDEAGINYLKKNKVKTIIAITPDTTEKELSEKAKITYIEIPFQKEDGINSDIITKFLQTIDNNPKKYYIHCNSGTNRAGTLAAVYRKYRDDWEFEKLYDEFIKLGGEDEKYPKLMEPLYDN